MSWAVNLENLAQFNAEGKLKQVEYASRAADLGSTCLALSNDKLGIIIAHVPLASKLAKPQDKIFKITEEAVFTFSGITNDGMKVVKYLKDNALYESIFRDRSIHYLEVFDDFSFEAARRSLGGGLRMYGMQGIFMMDYDGIKIMHLASIGTITETYGASIGYRAQSCNSILEDELANFEDASEDELIRIGMRALWNAFPDPDENRITPDEIQIVVLESGKGLKYVDASHYMV